MSVPLGYDPYLNNIWGQIHGKLRQKVFKETLVGIEIELEGDNLVNMDTPTKYWGTHEEGSLRGGVEYVLIKPIGIPSLDDVLKEFVQLTRDAVFKNSIRTSTHIHVNALTFSILEIYTILSAYYMLENILVRLNGKDREGNLHCLRVKDATHIVAQLSKEIEDRTYLTTWSNNHRYAACNLSALSKFGSLEFRFMKAYTQKEDLSLWVRNLVKMVNCAKKFKTPKEVIQFYYNNSIRDFLRYFFTDHFMTKMEGFADKELKSLCSENACYVYEIISGLAHSHKEEHNYLFLQQHEDLKNPVSVPDQPQPQSEGMYTGFEEHDEDVVQGILDDDF